MSIPIHIHYFISAHYILYTYTDRYVYDTLSECILIYVSKFPITNKSDNIVVHIIFTCEGIHKSDHFHAYIFPRTLDDYKTHLMDT